MKRVLVGVAAIAVMVAGSACSPVRAEKVEFSFTGDALSTDEAAPTGGEAILVVRNLSDRVIRPVLMRVPGDPRKEIAGADVVAGPDEVAARRQQQGAIAARVHIDTATFRLFLKKGTYIVLPEGEASYANGDWLAFEVG